MDKFFFIRKELDQTSKAFFATVYERIINKPGEQERNFFEVRFVTNSEYPTAQAAFDAASAKVKEMYPNEKLEISDQMKAI